MKYKKVLTPDGFNDCLDIHFAYTNEIKMKLHNIFTSYGYNGIKTPTLEFFEVFNNKGSMSPENIFKFIDNDGEVLALRPDITPSIARITAKNFDDKKIPFRFCYIDNSFAMKRANEGRLRELTQAGVELIGINSVESDSEVILLAINALLESGINSFKIDIGNVNFLQGILLDLKLDSKQIETIENLIINREFFDVSNYISDFNIDSTYKEFLNNLQMFKGDYKIIENAKKYAKNIISKEALDRLFEVYKFLEDSGVGEFINFDLSMIGRFDYYTGIIFYGYTENVDFSIIDGGRYDNLIANFGVDLPAVGFSIKVNELVEILFKQNNIALSRETHTLVSFSKDGRSMALQTINKLREDGLVFELSLFNDIDKSKEYAKNNGFGGILYFKDDDKVDIINIKTNEIDEVNISDLL